MRSVMLSAALSAGLMMSAPVMAQNYNAPADAQIDETQDAMPALSSVAERLGDPQKQREIGLMLQALSEVLLDLPIAPLAEAAAEITGDDPADVDPHMTLRSVAPQSSDIPEKIGENVPRAMSTIASLAKGLETMLPALRDMAARAEDIARDQY